MRALLGFPVGCLDPSWATGRERFGEMEFQSDLILTGCCVDISSVFVQRDDDGVGNENVSKAVETSVEVYTSCIKILDG